MRYMLLHKTNANLEAGQPPDPEILARADEVLEEMRQAGVLLIAEGLMPSARGARIAFPEGQPRVIDGPFTETKELVAGYTLIQVKSKEEAMEWVRRFPTPHLQDGEIEVRQLYELEDFGPSETVERFRDMGVATEK